MNILLVDSADFIDERMLVIRGRRFEHLKKVLRIEVGREICTGVLNGAIGSAKVIHIDREQCTLKILHLTQAPPPTLPLTLLLGLPRPRMLQRTLQTIATMGVERLCLIQTNRVEKSFWQTPLLKPENVREQLLIGLEQAKATQLPTIEFHKRFRPFAEDTLPELSRETQNFIAHPGNFPQAYTLVLQPTCLAIGPEGGFIDKEIEYFLASGFNPIQIGERILRVETAVPVLLAKLFN